MTLESQPSLKLAHYIQPHALSPSPFRATKKIEEKRDSSSKGISEQYLFWPILLCRSELSTSQRAGHTNTQIPAAKDREFHLTLPPPFQKSA